MKTLPKQLVSQINTFSAEAKRYSKAYALEPWQEKYVDTLTDNLRGYKGKVIVDSASGSGYIAIELAKRGSNVIACDLNMTALIRIQRIARELQIHKRLITVCCTSEHLPIRKNSVDAVNANAILEHLPDEAAAIQSMTDIVKRGAIAVITVPISYHLINPLLLPVNVIQDRLMGHLRRYTKESLVQKFSGWKLIRVYYIGHSMKVFKTLVNLIHQTFDPVKLEEDDAKLINKKLFATNICVVFKK